VKTSIAIFDGFSTKAKVDEAKARYNQAVLKKEDVVDQLVVDVKGACLDLRQAKAIIDSQKDSIAEAREALRLSEVRYDNGVGINLEVLDAQVALAQVQQNLAQGIYDYIMGKAQLDKVTGREFSAVKEANNGSDQGSGSERADKKKKS
jgi:outer membrane protein TolC